MMVSLKSYRDLVVWQKAMDLVVECSAGSLRRSRLSSLLVISQLALAMVLLIGAGLLIRSFQRLTQVELGYYPRSILTLRISLPEVKYTQPQQWTAFFQQLLERIKTLPGVQAAGLTRRSPTGDQKFVVENPCCC